VSEGKYEEIELLDPHRRYLSEVLYYKRHFALIYEECQGARSLLDVGCGTGHLLDKVSCVPRHVPGGYRTECCASGIRQEDGRLRNS
jgi:2-polyprenyl-3-methyl-5-hydroxy-6-metoxy-1,4-benzoquinol methylase